MVFELTDGIAQYKPEQRELLSICIENLLVGYYEGNLILIISRPLCSFIRNNQLVKSDRALVSLHYIETNGGYLPDVQWRIKIVLENADSNDHQLDYTFFSKSMATQPTSFLCENIEDVRFYMKLTSIYYPNTPIIANYYHGGGRTTDDMFYYLMGRNVVCIVILDSDIKYPDCDYGETAKKCLKRYKKKLVNIELKVLDVHEAENLVPLAFMKTHTYDKNGARFLEKMSQRGLLHYLRYYDIKKGIRKDSAMAKADYLKFCKEMYEKLYPFRRNSFEKYLEQKRKDEDRLFPIIRLDMLNEFNADKKGPYPVDLLENERQKIAALVHTFVCCRGFDPIN